MISPKRTISGSEQPLYDASTDKRRDRVLGAPRRRASATLMPRGHQTSYPRPEPNVEMTRAEGPVRQPKNTSTSRTWRTGRLLTRPSASVPGGPFAVSPATSRSKSHSLCSDLFAASLAARPTHPLTPHSWLSGKRGAPSSSPRSSTRLRREPQRKQTVPGANGLAAERVAGGGCVGTAG